MGKKKSASAPPGSNWLSLQKALPSKGKTAAKRKRLGSTLASPTSSTLPPGEDPAPVYSTRASTSRSAVRVVAEDGIDDASNEVKQLRKLILGVGTAAEALVGEPGRYLALDCEMVGVGEGAKESSLARASIVDYHGRVVLDEYVQQRERVTDYRTQWSGIRPEDMIHAKPFREVQDRVAELLAPADRILVGHALHNDLSALLLSHPASRTRDTQVYAGKKPAPRPIKSRSKGKQSADTLDADTLAPTLWEKYRTPHVGLKKLVKGELDVDIQQGEHSSVTDARAAMAIYRLHKRAWDASLPISHLRTQPAKHVLDEGVDSEESGTESLGRPKRKRRKSASSESAPGGGRRGVSSGLSTIVRSGAREKGMNTRDTKIFAATKGRVPTSRRTSGGGRLAMPAARVDPRDNCPCPRMSPAPHGSPELPRMAASERFPELCPPIPLCLTPWLGFLLFILPRLVILPRHLALRHRAKPPARWITHRRSRASLYWSSRLFHHREPHAEYQQGLA
ncbi:exonuclease domain protein [Ceratobasidium sp. AG-Ba]|nr:exonuclease domain protein [Ceratobasidium sp. AG-Ba]